MSIIRITKQANIDYKKKNPHSQNVFFTERLGNGQKQDVNSIITFTCPISGSLRDEL